MPKFLLSIKVQAYNWTVSPPDGTFKKTNAIFGCWLFFFAELFFRHDTAIWHNFIKYHRIINVMIYY